MQQRRSLTTTLACLAIAGAAFYMYLQWREMGSSGPGKVYFSNDDGQTFFVDDGLKIPPFMKDGKPAYRAHVFACEGKRVVGYLSGYTPDALKLMEEAKASRGTGKPPANVHRLATIGTTGLILKRPGDKEWVPQADARRATAIRVFKCKDGSTPQEVDP